MLGNVMLKLLPFLFLFLSMIIVFMFIQMTLGLTFDTEGSAYSADIGPLAYFLFLVRTSLGDFEVE